MTLRPCLEPGCPNLTRTTRCPACESRHQSARNRARPQYAGSWPRLSRQARKSQPWCTRCGATADLTLDHETGTVECRSCNASHRGTTVPQWVGG